MQIDPLGDSAIIVRLRGISAPGVEATEAVLAATARLRAAQITGVVEVAPAYTTVAVFYDATRVMFDALQTEITSVLSGELAIAAQQQAGRAVEIRSATNPISAWICLRLQNMWGSRPRKSSDCTCRRSIASRALASRPVFLT
jgi:hypothetical protein